MNKVDVRRGGVSGHRHLQRSVLPPLLQPLPACTRRACSSFSAARSASSAASASSGAAIVLARAGLRASRRLKELYSCSEGRQELEETVDAHTIDDARRCEMLWACSRCRRCRHARNV